MKLMEEAKRKYDEIPIPEELSDRIQRAVDQSDERRKADGEPAPMRRGGSMMKRNIIKATAAAAAMTVVFTAALNTSTAFADSVGGIPVLGTIAKVLTFKSYETARGDLNISVEIPSIEIISEDMKGLEDSVNQEIHGLCESYAEESVKRAEEYREAFLDTGGTEEEWAAHNLEVRVWYEVKARTENYLSLAVMGSENWNNANSGAWYYSINLKNGKMAGLQDVLGSDYVRTVNESIKRQMKVKEKETDIRFMTPEEGGFAGIDENTGFYINEAGKAVIVFEKYEIAPGSAGEIEFVIE